MRIRGVSLPWCLEEMPQLGDLSKPILRAVGALPKIPSTQDKETLQSLEKLKVSTIDSSYAIEAHAPITCGSIPERIVVEVRKKRTLVYTTYWYYWSCDRFEGDHKDWEPATLVYSEGTLVRIDSRIHDGLVSYKPISACGPVTIYFPKSCHTPTVSVNDREHDITFYPLNDGSDDLRKLWLNHCYGTANRNRWLRCNSPKLETSNGPVVDIKNWEKWGKHSIYLRI